MRHTSDTYRADTYRAERTYPYLHIILTATSALSYDMSISVYSITEFRTSESSTDNLCMYRVISVELLM